MSSEFAMQIDPSYELIGARNVRVELTISTPMSLMTLVRSNRTIVTS